MKKPVKMLSEYQRLAKKTNALGLTDYDIKALTNQQKGQLTRLENSEFKDAIKNPKFFTILDAPKAFLKRAKQAGALATKSKLFVRNKYDKGAPRYTKIRIENGMLKFSEVSRSKTQRVEELNTVIYPGTKDFLKMSEELRDKKYKLSQNSKMTFKIGGNSPFQTDFADFEKLHAYVSDMVAGKVFRNIVNGKAVYNVDFGKILPEISFVQIKRRKLRVPKSGT